MPNIRNMVLAAVTVVAFGAGWLAHSNAQQNPASAVITYFRHEKVDASFAAALGSTGSKDLFSRKDSQGRSFAVHANSRGKSDEGELHSHQGWTGVVIVMSGAATFITPGAAAKTTAPNALGGQSIGGGETHRVSKGDVVVIPPGAPHMYKDIEGPFRYLVVETPL